MRNFTTREVSLNGVEATEGRKRSWAVDAAVLILGALVGFIISRIF